MVLELQDQLVETASLRLIAKHTMSTAGPIPQAVLSYITTSSYPQDDTIFSSTLQPNDLTALLSALQQSRDEVKAEISQISRSTAGDTDTWISRAASLKADIARSRDTARQIVADAEACKQLKEDAEEKGRNVGLLEAEVRFNEQLTGTLERVREVRDLLERTREEAAVADVRASRGTLAEIFERLEGLEGVVGERTMAVLKQQTEELKSGITETVKECWDGIVRVNVEERNVEIDRHGLAVAVPGSEIERLDLDTLAWAAKELDVFDETVRKLAKDLDRAILRPSIIIDDDGCVAKLEVRKSRLSCAGKSGDTSEKKLFEDLRTILDFLSSRLPDSVAVPLCAEFMPVLTSRLESQWLEPAIPLEMKQIPQFQILLDHVSEFVDHIEDLGWSGSDGLRDWVEYAPRAWLTKRREAVLGDVRNLVFEGLRERKTVERIETRVVSREDMGMAQPSEDESGEKGGGDDDWDNAWDESEETTPALQQGQATANKQVDDDDDDGSAWNVDDDDDDNNDASAKEGPTSRDEDNDAWGWGDEEGPKPESPKATKQQPKPASSRTAGHQELTLRESFTSTLVPAHLLTTLKTIISDAQTLATSPTYTSTSLSPASSALYTLPTLALAIYRATAPTAYSKLPGGEGNLLIYNDASHLATQLQEWQASEPASSRLRVDADVTALETLAKRAYGSEMSSQRTILTDLLDDAQGFGNSTIEPFKTSCANAVESVIERIRELARLWKPILSDSALLQSLGSLLSSVTRKVISDVEELGDIGEAESLQLKSLCDRVLGLNTLFVQHDPSSSGDGEGRDMTFIYCPTWLKFQYLTEILDSSLADIRWMWKEGELSLEFGADEVVELVEALFAESELRRQTIREIRKGR